MKVKEQIIKNLDFTKEEYEKVRTPNMVSFNEMVDNAIRSYDAIVADGWEHGDKVEDISYIINDMWGQIS